MVLESASLPGVSESSDGLSFFESDVGEVFNDIGDIWGDDGGLEWDFELDAALFGDPDVAEGLPVNRPEKPVTSGMTMTGLAKAVKEEEERLAREHDKKAEKAAPVPEKGQAIWSFDGFSQSSVEPPARHAIQRSKDVDLLDILHMKPASTPGEQAPVQNGFSAPKFPVLPEAVPKSPPKRKRKTAPRKKKVASVPVGSLTGSFLDLLPDRSPEAAGEGAPSGPETLSLLDVGIEAAVEEERESVTQVSPDPSEGSSDENIETVANSVADVDEPVGSVAQVDDRLSVEDEVSQAADAADIPVQDPVSAPERKAMADDVEEPPVEALFVEDNEGSSDGEEGSEGHGFDDIFLAGDEFVPLDDMLEIIDKESLKPASKQTFLPPRKGKEWPTNRRVIEADPKAAEIEIEDDLEDMEHGMSHFTSKDWGDA